MLTVFLSTNSDALYHVQYDPFNRKYFNMAITNILAHQFMLTLHHAKNVRNHSKNIKSPLQIGLIAIKRKYMAIISFVHWFLNIFLTWST